MWQAPASGAGVRPAEKPVLFSLSINIGGTAVPLDVHDGDIPKNVAAAFAKEHKVTMRPARHVYRLPLRARVVVLQRLSPFHLTCGFPRSWTAPPKRRSCR